MFEQTTLKSGFNRYLKQPDNGYEATPKVSLVVLVPPPISDLRSDTQCQVEYAMRQIQRLHDEGLAWMDVRADAMAAYNEALQRDISNVKVWQTNIHNYYRSSTNRIVTQYPHTMSEYRKRTSVDDRDAYEVRALGQEA